MLVCKSSGAKSWIVRVQANGKRRDVGLGSAADVPLSKARQRAIETRLQFQGGCDPVEAKRVSRRLLEDSRTFEDEARTFYAERSSGWSNEKHRAQWLSTMERYVFPDIGAKKIDAVTGPDVRELLVPIWQAKPETASRVLQRITSVLDYSHSRGLRDQEAPLRSIRAGLGKQVRRTKHFASLPHDKVGPLMAKLAENDSSGRLALRFLILTAARSGEVRGASWGEIDLNASIWTIPANRMKARRTHQVPLSPEAITVLAIAQNLRKSTRPSEPIFPGLGGHCLSDMTLTKALRVQLTGDWTVHGFRSSFRDWAAEETNFPPAAVETALAHTISNKTEAAYHRTQYLEKRREIMLRWAAYVCQ